jgi:hypothetical protein
LTKQTDKGKVYSIHFEHLVYYQKNHDYEGIVQIILFDTKYPDYQGHDIAYIEDEKVTYEIENNK